MPSSINASTTAGLVNTADTSGVLQLQTAGTTAISIDASQAVSFTNAPTVTGGTANGVAYLNGSKVLTTGSALTFDGATNKLGFQNAAANGYAYIQNVGAGTNTDLAFYMAATQAMTLNAAGNLLVGTTSTSFSSGTTAEISGSSTATLTLSNGATPRMYLLANSSESRTSSYGATPLTYFVNGAERARIDTNGNLLVGQTSGSNKLSVTGTVYLDSRVSTGYGSAADAWLGVFGSSNEDAVNGGAVYNMEWRISGNAGGQYWYSNYLTRGGSRTLGAYCTGTTWTNASDIVNKEDIVSIGYGLETVMASNPVDFRWKTMKDEDGLGKKDIGFIAQEMELIVPEVVTGEEGQKGISYGNLVAVAFKAIQEQQALITQLQADVAALKGA